MERIIKKGTKFLKRRNFETTPIAFTQIIPSESFKSSKIKVSDK